MVIYFFRNTGNVNYNVTANWSLTDGGGATGAVPTSSDDVKIANNSGNLTVNVLSVAKSIDFTNFTGTLTMTSSITVSGNVTLVAGMNITGVGNLTINSAATLTSAGKTWTGGLIFAGSAQTFTLADNWIVNGSEEHTSE